MRKAFTLIEVFICVAIVVLLGLIFLSKAHASGYLPIGSTAASGVKQADVSVAVQSNGLTVEQDNIKNRLLMDNKPGSIKHLYILSAYSGQCLIYSTVKGKVTSSGKRLTPTHLTGSGEYGGDYKNSSVGRTAEVLQDDGTYGSSAEYIYWWDVKGIYHQHYISGGQIVHISDQPLSVKSVVINMEEGEK